MFMMEESVDESERLVFLANLKQEEVDREKEEDDTEEKKSRGDDHKGREEVERGVGEEGTEEEDHKKEGVDFSGGGFINNLISNLPISLTGSRSGDDKRGEEEDDRGGQGTEEDNKKEDAGSSGGGLLNKLISNLPISIPADDPFPTADEASLLISIIHD